jgi:hypothetical protein
VVSKYGNPVSDPTFKPLNPWGRDFPKRPPRPDRTMWCVSVENRETKQRQLVGLVGPMGGAQMLCDAIKQQIELGKERRWADPQVVRIL